MSNLKGALTERFLIYGPEGVGKSECWLDLLANLEDQFFILDLDGSAAYSIANIDEKLFDRANIWDVSDPHGALVSPKSISIQETQWLAISKAAHEIRAAKPKPGSWVIIDRVDSCWNSVQHHWVTQAYGSDMSNYWAELRAEQIAAAQSNRGTERDFGGFVGKTDWVMIRKLYQSVMNGLLATPRTHKISIALAKEPFAQSAKAQEQKAIYGELMPAGEANQGADYWATLEIRARQNGERMAIVRRTKRRNVVERAANGSPKPITITDDKGNPSFHSMFYEEVWKK